MLFCPSFTHSEPFLQTDQLITRLQVVVMTNFIHMLTGNVIMNVFRSDAVIWWAAIFRSPSSMFDKLLHLQGSAMSRSRSCNCCEAISNLLTVTMYLQDMLSRSHCPGLHKIDLCHCEVLRNLSQCTRISTLSEFSSCLLPAGNSSSYTSSKTFMLS